MGHSPIGPSAAKRILACPGSVELVAKAPPQESSPYAQEGTKAHEVAEAYVLGKPLPSWATEEMIEGAKMYAGLIEDILLWTDNIQVPLQLEKKVCASSIRDDAWGTCDAFFVADDTVYVFDYKFGKGVAVDAFMNEQLLYYATAVRDTYNLIVGNVELFIVQPRNGGISKWGGKSTLLTEFRHRMKAALDSKELAINNACRRCPALAFCPKQLENIKDKFNVDPSEPIKEFPSVEELKPETYKAYLDNADLLESWIKAVRSQAFAAIGRGMIIDGYELTESLGNRKWKDEKEVARQFGGIEGIYDRKLKSPAQMEKVVPKEKLEPFIIRESTGKKLTRTTKQVPDLFEAFNVIGE